MITHGQNRRRSVLFLLLVFMAVPFFGSGQQTIKLLLRNLDADPSLFKKVATAELKFSFGSTSLVEGGLIGEDEFTRPGLTLVKSYGYYALRNSADRKLRKRLGLTRRNHSSWRDSSWNVQRERDWTGIKLSTSSDSVAGVLLQEALALGAREVQPCLRLTKVDEVAVEQKTYTVANTRLLVFIRYLYPGGARYDIKLSLCSGD